MITERDLIERMADYQKRLGLSDWDLRLKFMDARDMDQAQGKSNIYPTTQYAEIRIMRPGDRQASDQNDKNPELDMVHELIHIRLWAIDPPDAEGVLHDCREQAVEWIARALLPEE